eukprot:SAG31_NODE_5545_length_2466_cov_4.386143_2_plen_59_part_00
MTSFLIQSVTSFLIDTIKIEVTLEVTSSLRTPFLPQPLYHFVASPRQLRGEDNINVDL